jgi:hypothetical protein
MYNFTLLFLILIINQEIKKILFLVPSKNFEELRRKIFNDVKDISFYINARIDDNERKNKALIKENFNNRIK